MACRGSGASVALRPTWAKNLIEKTFGTNILDLRQYRLFDLLLVEALTNSIVDESHDAGRHDNAVIRMSAWLCCATNENWKDLL